jgi:hypothetical protein
MEVLMKKKSGLNIFGLEVPVKVSNLQDTGLEAYFDFVLKEIIIDQNFEHNFATRLHEFGHAVWFRLGLNQSKIPLSIQEIIVEGLSVALDENWEELAKWRKNSKKKSVKKLE